MNEIAEAKGALLRLQNASNQEEKLAELIKIRSATFAAFRGLSNEQGRGAASQRSLVALRHQLGQLQARTARQDLFIDGLKAKLQSALENSEANGMEPAQNANEALAASYGIEAAGEGTIESRIQEEFDNRKAQALLNAQLEENVSMLRSKLRDTKEFMDRPKEMNRFAEIMAGSRKLKLAYEEMRSIVTGEPLEDGMSPRPRPRGRESRTREGERGSRGQRGRKRREPELRESREPRESRGRERRDDRRGDRRGDDRRGDDRRGDERRGDERRGDERRGDGRGERRDDRRDDRRGQKRMRR